jgi:hypothetical protein
MSQKIPLLIFICCCITFIIAIGLVLSDPMREVETNKKVIHQFGNGGKVYKFEDDGHVCYIAKRHAVISIDCI